MDANERYLNQYMNEIAASDRAQDWKDNYIEELLSKEGDYYPFNRENFQEAIAELDLGKAILASSYAHVASVFPSESSNRNFSEYMIRIAREYWKECAEKKADADYDTYYQEQKSCQE
jgi:transposase